MTDAPSKRQVVGPGAETCSLSQSLERMVLHDPAVNSDHAGTTQWGPLALANMVAVLREHGYTVSEPTASSDHDKAAEVNWSDDTAICAAPFEAATAPSVNVAPPAVVNVDAEALARFSLLTSLIEQNRGEDGRIDAMNLQHLLLSRDSDAFEKEGVDQLKQYLMKARESGIPIKFDGDRGGLHQVWFKGHKDLSGALARYSTYGGGGKSPNSPSAGRHGQDGEWRRRPYQNQHQSGGGQRYMSQGYTIRNSDMSNRYRTPSERAFDIDFLLDVLHNSGADYNQGADANLVEQKLLEVAQSLYESKAGVKRFNHYLMNMRASGAPIWFSRDDDGLPKEIFIKSMSTAPAPIPFPNPSLMPAHGGVVPANDWSGIVPQNNLERFGSLIEAYQYHLQPEDNLADGYLVQSRLEAMDGNIYSREQCSTFKRLLQLAKMTGIDMNWEQTDTGVSTIRMRLPSQQQQQQPYHQYQHH